MSLLILLLSLFMPLSAVYAQVSETELPYLFIPSYELPRGMSDFERSQINKTVIKVATKQKGYQVILGDPESNKKTKWTIFRVDLAISVSDDHYDIDARLMNVKKNTLFHSVTELNVPRIEFFRTLQDVINRLFLPPETIAKETIPKDQIEPPEKVKNPILPVPVPESQQAAINFRERIMSLKSGVNQAVDSANKLKEAKKTDNTNDKVDDEKKSNSLAAETALMQDNPLDPKVPLPPTTAPPVDLGHSLRLGYYTFATNSKHYIETDANPRYLLFDYEYARGWSGSEPWKDFYHHFNVRYGKTLNKQVKEFAPYTGFSLFEGYHFSRLGWMPKIGLEVDTISFVNLPEPGQGQKVANNQITWLVLGSVNNFTIFNRGFRFSAAYGSALGVKTGYPDLKKVTGSKLNFTLAMLNIYKKFHAEVNYFQSDLEGDSEQPLTFSTQGIGYNVFYNF